MKPPIEPLSGERLGVPAHLLQGRPGDHFVLRVVGDSMTAEGILDGDYVVILRRDPEPGEVTVCTVGDDATVKYWFPEEGDVVRLESTGGTSFSFTVPRKDVRTTGVAVGVMRQWKRREP